MKISNINGITIGARKRIGLPYALKSKFLYLWTGKYDGNDNLLSDLDSTVITINNTVNDWFLPSLYEANEMYDELHLYGVGNFLAGVDDFYWTSTEYTGIDGAWVIGFNDGHNGGNDKGSSFHVRPIRAFTSATNYNLRDVGPAGGWIFWKSGNDYLEAANSDQNAQEWSNIQDTDIGITAQGFAIGTGQTNTTAIIGQAGHTGSAAKLCNDLISGGKDYAGIAIPETTNCTFTVPNNATFIAADLPDRFWFLDGDVLALETFQNLITSSPTRTFVKYTDFEPYSISAIGILKEGEVLTTADKIALNKFFKLWFQYWGTDMDNGYMKDNRTLVEANLVTDWTNAGGNPFDVFTTNGNIITRGYQDADDYSFGTSNLFAVTIGDKLLITADLTATAGARPYLTIVGENVGTDETLGGAALAAGNNYFEYDVIKTENVYMNVNRALITDFALTLVVQKA